MPTRLSRQSNLFSADRCGALNPTLQRSTRSSGSVKRPSIMVSPSLCLPCKTPYLIPTAGTLKEYGIKKKAEAVRNTRKIGKKDMKLNNAMPKMTGELEYGTPS